MVTDNKNRKRKQKYERMEYPHNQTINDTILQG